ncbi:Cytochrome c, mono-and diheme variants [Roseateles sp. YR242]|uniref:cytochrome c n=1 Tax=Roseateles sp. YR242 TaxID=1855305 RepID=UPI0008C8075F|nr:cytochrome c [Roseateles sp. YR242]SEK38442.1 Cytochrome c, mono-and diheme variants [Roseateles sp. YR242]
MKSQGCAALSLLLSLCACPGLARAQDTQDAKPEAALIERGRQLSIAADCAACHTAPKGGAPFAGGYGIESPMGDIIATNITPSQSHGIGSYTLAQFRAALREGVRKDGTHLYPAMPYTAYTQLTDADTQALYAYFMHAVKPVDQPVAETKLPFPFSIRASMAVWNALFLKDERFKPDPAQPELVNRGAYLSNALAHCSACHTPRNMLMAEQVGKPFLSGGSVGPWFAPNITSDPVQGVGGWSDDELLQYMKTGRVQGKAQAAGPMAEAIEHSLQHLPDEDLKAIVAYLKQVAPVGGDAAKPRYGYGEAAHDEFDMRGLTQGADAGWRVFSGSCAHCHQANGTGTSSNEYPSLFNNTATGGDRADNLIATILHGVNRTVQGKPHFMPAFGDEASYTDRLSDQEIADLSNYVLTRYGNHAVKVSADDVRVAREGGPKPFLVKARPAMVPAMVLVALLLLAAVIALLRRRGQRAH